MNLTRIVLIHLIYTLVLNLERGVASAIKTRTQFPIA